MPPYIGWKFSACCFFWAYQAWGHVWNSLDFFVVEVVVFWVFGVEEDSVMFCWPASFGAPAVVIGPDDFIDKSIVAEDGVEKDFAVVGPAVIDVEVEGAMRG